MLHVHVAEGIHRVEDAYVNWYLVEDGRRLTIVDAGTPRSWRSFEQALASLGRERDAVAALVLTHAHFDHIGFAERARVELGIDVWVHEDDVPLTRHPLMYGRERSPLGYLARHAGGRRIVGALARERALLPSPIRHVRRFRAEDGPLPVPGAPRVVRTPGHTLGHCVLHLPDRDAALVGDALVTLDPYTGLTGPRIVARAATADSERASASLDAIAATGARTLLPGHGEPWTGGAEAAVAQARVAGVR